MKNGIQRIKDCILRLLHRPSQANSIEIKAVAAKNENTSEIKRDVTIMEEEQGAVMQPSLNDNSVESKDVNTKKENNSEVVWDVTINQGEHGEVDLSVEIGDRLEFYMTTAGEALHYILAFRRIQKAAEERGYVFYRVNVGGGVDDLDTGYMSFSKEYSSLDEMDKNLYDDFERAEREMPSGWYSTLNYSWCGIDFKREGCSLRIPDYKTNECLECGVQCMSASYTRGELRINRCKPEDVDFFVDVLRQIRDARYTEKISYWQGEMVVEIEKFSAEKLGI